MGGEGPRSSARPRITLLHMSDVQFGKHHLFGRGGLTDKDQRRDVLFARLHEDLVQLREVPGLRPDLLVISGDLAEWADAGRSFSLLLLHEAPDASLSRAPANPKAGRLLTTI